MLLSRGDAAFELHRSVPADRWCVTSSDLAFLYDEVLRALRSGQIRPRNADAFEEALGPHGPSIYTVNEEYIKPVTYQAGKMSWALMRNPNGLDCDVFISHAWQEGIFEFLTKVKYAWPMAMETAWCCMLANPQNLDISFFLTSPATSPFAIALRASEVMLVVPNRRQSVYTRLWCAYEAYLAQDLGKTILIAKSSNRREIFCALEWMFVSAMLGAAVGLLAFFLGIDVYGVQGLTSSLLALSLVVNNDILRRVLNLVGQMMCFWLHLSRMSGIGFEEKCQGSFVHEASQVIDLSFWLMISMVFCVLEIDRVNGKSIMTEAEELQQGYQGSIQYAKCTQEADAARIRAEIGNHVHQVDNAIHVLMKAGMSTPALREIAHLVDIEHAAFSEIAGAAIFFGPMSIDGSLTGFFWHSRSWYLTFLAGVSVLPRLILLLLLCRSHWDQQRFILKVMNKFVFVGTLGWLFLMLCHHYSLFHMTCRADWFGWLLIVDFCFVSILMFALLGIRGTAKLPLGPRILRIFFARGRNAWNLTQTSATAAFAASDTDGSGTDSSE